MKSSSAALFGFCVVLMLVLLAPIPPMGRVVSSLLDLAHAPAFALLAVLVAVAGRRVLPRSRLGVGLTVWVLVATTGTLLEAVQTLTGRAASAHDIVANMLGAAAGLLWKVCDSSSAVRIGARVLCVLMVGAAGLTPLLQVTDCCLQQLEMPRLASFEHSLELSRWSFRECRIRRVRRHATHGDFSLEIDLSPGVFPGMSLEWPTNDWSSYGELVFDVTLENGPPFDLIVKIEDTAHNHDPNDRFERRVRLSPGRQRVRIALADVAAAPLGRCLDLRQISFLQFFAVRPHHPHRLFVDNICLQ